MKSNTTVVPKIGRYVVITVDHRWGMQIQYVGKNRRCSCGGNGRRPCRHIRAVADYLHQGGKRAPETSEERPAPRLRDKQEDGPPSGTPMTCPICGTPVETQDIGFWRCPKDASHYWQWRGEQTGIKSFLTRSHPAKSSAFHSMTPEEREAFLDQATRRMHKDGYTPYG
jgi:hypothetical protein